MRVAVSRVLKRLRRLPQPPNPTLTVKERNRIIRARFAAGESEANLARVFGISYQRIHQIVRPGNSKR
jgi:hypothetical protein